MGFDWFIWVEHHTMPFSKQKTIIERIIINTYTEMVCRCPFQSWKLYLKGSPLALEQKFCAVEICSPNTNSGCYFRKWWLKYLPCTTYTQKKKKKSNTQFSCFCCQKPTRSCKTLNLHFTLFSPLFYQTFIHAFILYIVIIHDM